MDKRPQPRQAHDKFYFVEEDRAFTTEPANLDAADDGGAVVDITPGVAVVHAMASSLPLSAT